VRRAEPLAGLGGLLLLVSLFLPWYGLDTSFAMDAQQHVLVSGDPPELSGWQALSVIDVLLAILAVPAILVPLLSVATRGPAKAIAIAVIASATGWLAVLLVAVRLVVHPDGFALRYGAWLALAGAVLAWVGSWLSMRDDSTPGAVAPDIPRRPAPV
jgi:hypothetical protein